MAQKRSKRKSEPTIIEAYYKKEVKWQKVKHLEEM